MQTKFSSLRNFVTTIHNRMVVLCVLFVSAVLAFFLLYELNSHSKPRALSPRSPTASADQVQQPAQPHASNSNDGASSSAKPVNSNDAPSSVTARAAMRCLHLKSELARIEFSLSSAQGSTLPMMLSGSEADLDRLSEKLQKLRSDFSDDCRKWNTGQLLATAADATRSAARAGDFDAQLCVIEQKFLGPRAMGLNSDEVANREAYLNSYHDSAYYRGDWRIVQLDAERTLTIGHGPLGTHMAAMPPVDKATYYRSLLLLRMGAVDGYATALEREITKFKEFVNQQDDGGGKFSIEDMDREAARARDDYDRYFKDSNKLYSPPVPCGDE